MSQGYIDGSVRTFQEESAGAMTDKNYLLVKQATAANEVELCDTAGEAAIGVAQSKLHDDATDVPVRLLNSGGTVKVKIGGNVALGDPLQADTDAMAIVATTADHVLGRALQAGVDGDVIEMLPQAPTIF